MAIIVFCAMLALYVGIGFWAQRGDKGEISSDTYLVADRSVSPIFVALSAAATKYSGYMFIAFIGYVYTFGLSAIWLLLGAVTGDLVSFILVHSKVRQKSAEVGAVSYPELLSRWLGEPEYTRLRLVIGIVCLLFLTTYAAAQFGAGAKALHVLFGWDYYIGLIVGCLLVMSYSLSGGLKSSILTDVLQAIIMTLAMAILLWMAVKTVGGADHFIARADAVSPTYLDWGIARFGSWTALILFIAGWFAEGVGITGQPHVMVRFMSLSKTGNIKATGVYYYGFTVVFLIVTFLTGMATRVMLGSDISDAELALPLLANAILPAALIGIVISGIFAAVMSTADSLVLSSSAVLSDDLRMVTGSNSRKASTFLVCMLALVIGLVGTQSIFVLVSMAWAAMASAFGPILIVYALGGRISQSTALVMLFTGLAVAMGWRSAGLSTEIYEALPGMSSAFAVYFVAQWLIKFEEIFPQTRLVQKLMLLVKPSTINSTS